MQKQRVKINFWWETEKKAKNTVQGRIWEKVKGEKVCEVMILGADPNFYFYCNSDGRDGERNEYTLRKSQVTLDHLAMILNVNYFYIPT